MTPEYLERLAQAINEKFPEWDAVAGVDRLVVGKPSEDFDPFFDSIHYFFNVPSDDDNARWIIWCLDRLEELGEHPLLGKEWERFIVFTRQRKNGHLGKTRAKAVTRALGKVLGVEE